MGQNICTLHDFRQASGVFTTVAVQPSSLTAGQQRSKAQYQALCDVMWHVFYTFTRTHACSQTPSPDVADVAASFTLLASQAAGPSAGAPLRDANSCFMYFSSQPNVNPKVTCSYLVHLLRNPDVMTTLRHNTTDDVTTVLVKAWLHCTWLLPPTDSHLLELNRSMTSVDVVQRAATATSAQLDDDVVLVDSAPTSASVLAFIKHLGCQFVSCQDLRARQDMRNHILRYFSDVINDLSQATKNCSLPEQMVNVYTVAGHLVKYCANVFYVKVSFKYM